MPPPRQDKDVTRDYRVLNYRPNVLTSYRPKKCAFTLAEVLITLGIIGVVAAMTIPALIHKFNNKALEAQYKKSVSIISQVIMKAKADYGLEKFAYYCAYYPYPADSGMPYDHDTECYEILYKTLL